MRKILGCILNWTASFVSLKLRGLICITPLESSPPCIHKSNPSLHSHCVYAFQPFCVCIVFLILFSILCGLFLGSFLVESICQSCSVFWFLWHSHQFRDVFFAKYHTIIIAPDMCIIVAFMLIHCELEVTHTVGYTMDFMSTSLIFCTVSVHFIAFRLVSGHGFS